MKKLLSLSLATAVSAAFLAQPVMSQEDGIVVTPGIPDSVFVEKVSRDLDHQLRRAARPEDPSADGIVIVRFTRGSDGGAEDLAYYRRSGSWQLDRHAMRAVARLHSLDAVPESASAGQLYQANIVFASTRKSARKLYSQLAEEEALRIAASEGKPEVFAVSRVPTDLGS